MVPPVLGRLPLAFRGTAGLLDVASDVGNALDFAAAKVDTQYLMAYRIGTILKSNHTLVSFAGHSLGGGLAATASFASGAHAVTLDAASPGRKMLSLMSAKSLVMGGNQVLRNIANHQNLITNYFPRNEPLTTVENFGVKPVSSLLGWLGMANPDASARVGSWLVPASFGKQVELLVAPMDSNTPFWGLHSSALLLRALYARDQNMTRH
jgi:hypothetical protein